MVGYAERGERIDNAPIREQQYLSIREQGLSFLDPSPLNRELFFGTANGEQSTGRYQLEIRRTSDRAVGDSNERFSNSTSLQIPPLAVVQAGVVTSPGIRDGHTFRISDGVGSVNFEFVQTDASPVGTLTPGNVGIFYTAADTQATLATKVRDAVNNPSVQNRIRIRAAGADGSTNAPMSGNKIDLFGNALVFDIDTTANPIAPAVFAQPFIKLNSSTDDRNLVREQGQVIVANNTIRQARDYGVWSEPGTREYDPRDTIDTYSTLQFYAGGPVPDGYDPSRDPFARSGLLVDDGTEIGRIVRSTFPSDSNDVQFRTELSANFARTDRQPESLVQSRPPSIGSSPGPTRNLQQLNNSLEGGFAPGAVVYNNILDQSGLGGVHIESENSLIALTPNYLQTVFNTGVGGIAELDHESPGDENYGESIPDGKVIIIDAGRTRVSFEFEDLFTSDGWNPQNVPVFYNGATTGASSAYEVLKGLYDSILGSILVTNGTTQTVKPTLAMGAFGPEYALLSLEKTPNGNRFRNAQSFLEGSQTIWPTSGTEDTIFPPPNNNTQDNLDWANLPTLYLDGVTGVYDPSTIPDQFLNLANAETRPETAHDVLVGINSIFNVREARRSPSPQSFARVLNNTIIGNDGTASLAAPLSVDESFAGLRSVTTNMGTTGSLQLTFTKGASVQDLTIRFQQRDLGANAGPIVPAIVGTDLTIVLNTNAANPTTVRQLLNSINASNSPLRNLLTASLTAGGDGIVLGGAIPNNFILVMGGTNDEIGTAVPTMQGIGHSPATFTMNGTIGDNRILNAIGPNRAANDVDMYQFRLDIGDRVLIDIDTTNSGLDATLQLFDSAGRLVNLTPNLGTSSFVVDDQTAPDNTPFPDPNSEVASNDPFSISPPPQPAFITSRSHPTIRMDRSKIRSIPNRFCQISSERRPVATRSTSQRPDLNSSLSPPGEEIATSTANNSRSIRSRTRSLRSMPGRWAVVL